MDQKTAGTVVSVKKQWWLKVNTKPIRMNTLDGATFPHIIKVSLKNRIRKTRNKTVTGGIYHAG